MNNKSYWEKFYKKYHNLKPTSFAKFCLPYIPKHALIFDLGSGTGRDSYYFGRKRFWVVGIDCANLPKSIKNVYFHKKNFKDLFVNSINNWADVIYSRFFVHSITDEEIDFLLDRVKNLFMAEFRAEEDIPILYPKHYRNKINGEQFLQKLIQKGFEILYYNKSRNLAKFKNENPIVIRVIAKK